MTLENLMRSMGKTKAVCVGLGVGMVAAGMLTIGTRNILGEDLGGASIGQPKTTHPNWAQATKGYSDFQRCNPIRKDATFGRLKYKDA